MKTLNIDVRVRRMDAKSILTSSIQNAGDWNGGDVVVDAPARQGGASAGTTPVRAGF